MSGGLALARRLAKTAARGLAGQHPKDRQAALRALRDGDPCFRCQLRGVYHPLSRESIVVRPDGRLVTKLLEWDHYPGRAVGGPQLTGLSWARCNRQAGTRLLNAMKRARKAAMAEAEPYSRW